MTTLVDLINRAHAATDNHQTTSIALADGGVLFCSVRRRAANSRGANRGKHGFVEFNYKAPGEQYSKRVSRDVAGKTLQEGGCV